MAVPSVTTLALSTSGIKDYCIANFTFNPDVPISLSGNDTVSLHCYRNEPSGTLSHELSWKVENGQESWEVKKCSVHLNIPFKITDALSRLWPHYFQLFVTHGETMSSVTVHLCLGNYILHDVTHANDRVNIKDKASVMEVLQFFCDIEYIDYPNSERSHSEHIENLYNDLYLKRQEHLKAESQPNLTHPTVVSELRPYQQQAVRWMQNVENSQDLGDRLHPSYVEFTTKDEKIVYFHLYFNYFTTRKFLMPSLKRAGILADEMGLGKTLEILFVIVSNPNQVTDESQPKVRKQCVEVDQNVNCNTFDDMDVEDSVSNSDEANFHCACGLSIDRFHKRKKVMCKTCKVVQHVECIMWKATTMTDDYMCPLCSILNVVGSRASLIISPKSICQQWVDEIKKHLIPDSLKVFVYQGIKKHKFIPPSVLANNDIVLTTYEVLRAEVRYTKVQHNCGSDARSHRYPRKYFVIPTPLTAVLWWRICLDEAQMVESTTSKSAEMALALLAINRWCVTGTPIQRTIEDIYGLFCFLDYEPYTMRKCWKELLSGPFSSGNQKRMIEALHPVFWRTTKAYIESQLNIPIKIEVSHPLSFSSVESYYYGKQYMACYQNFADNVEKFVRIKMLDRNVLNKVLQPVRKLRLACCHPQVQLGIHKPLTMKEVASSLVKQVENECQELHRQNIAALNGIAGLYFLTNEQNSAIEKYCEVLISAKQHADIFKTDSVQQIHALANLLELVNEKNFHETVSLSSDFESLAAVREHMNQLTNNYLSKYQEVLMQTFVKLDDQSPVLQETKDGFHFPCKSPWWANLLHYIRQMRLEEEFITKLLLAFEHMPSFIELKSIDGVSFLCTRMSDSISESRESVINSLQHFRNGFSDDDVIAGSQCHLRPVTGAERCILCETEGFFRTYEVIIFNIMEKENARRLKRKHIEDEDTSEAPRSGNWADGPFEQIMKFLQTFIPPLKAVPKEILEDSVQCVKYLELLKKEFKILRAVWLNASSLLGAMDEVKIASTRYRLRELDELNVNVPSNVLHASEVPLKLSGLLGDKASAEWRLKRTLGKLAYLKNLYKSYCSDKPNEDTCPCCKITLFYEWSVFICGHSVCLTCLAGLKRTSLCEYVVCPVCRERAKVSQIAFVMQKESDLINRQFSTKISAVVKCLLNIKSNDTCAKSLVFSSWPELLAIIGQALEANGLRYLNLASAKDFQATLSSFKKDENINILLLPIKTGANGLNIIEANHVLLVEPLMNISIEKQAVSRVHRIGQTKETIVHRFYVQETIEERIMAMEKDPRASLLQEDNVPLNKVLQLFQKFDDN